MRMKQTVKWSHKTTFFPYEWKKGVKVAKPLIKETWKLWWSEMLVPLFAWYTPAVCYCYQGCIFWHYCLTCTSKLKTAMKMNTTKLRSTLHWIFVLLRLQVLAILLWNIFELLYLVSNLLPSLLIIVFRISCHCLQHTKGTHIKTCKHL